MKNEEYWDGFIAGLFVGAIISIVVFILFQKGML